MPGATDLVFYASGHGYGHARRASALLAALRRLRPELRVAVRTNAPAWIFTQGDPQAEVEFAELDPGVVQTSALAVDRTATFEAHRLFMQRWSGLVEHEAKWLRQRGARLVVADVAPLGIAAASARGIPAALVANFTWDWIFGEWAREDPRWRPVAQRYGEAYARARVAYRPPHAGPFPPIRRVIDMPLVAHRCALERAAARGALDPAGARDARRWLLLSFGGFGSMPLDFGSDDLAGYRFLSLDRDAPPGFRGDWLRLAPEAARRHECVMAACDAVLGKLGYGTVAEALAHRTRFLYLPRADFPEIPLLEEWLLAQGCARRIDLADLSGGHLPAALDALFAQPLKPAPPSDGAERIAGSLLALLDAR